ncbi:hypothetical protein R3P38DRAFT_3337551 [Favolaschia claudopus]|uniref:Uncharacterized protein n=1 Tax=Favolaschia claudopus TaxID=2862362 RepID=A0AAV9Z1H5_9AGAR
MPHQIPPPPKIKLVSENAGYTPPLHPIDSDMGIADATTLILLQKMIADSYEHGRAVWKENKARCAATGEIESAELPCGPNEAQKNVEAWLVEAGLLAPDAEDSDDEGDYNGCSSPALPLPTLPVPPTPETPTRRPWHRRLQITIPSSKNSTLSISSPASLKSPRSPLSPLKLWSSIQRSTSSLPTVLLKSKRHKFEDTQNDPSPLSPSPSLSPPPSPCADRRQRKKCRSLDSAMASSSPSTPPKTKPTTPDTYAPPDDTLLATAFKRAAMLGTITNEDADQIMRQMRGTAPSSSTHTPPSLDADDVFGSFTYHPATPKTKKKPKSPPHPELEFEDPASYRWPLAEAMAKQSCTPPSPPTPPCAAAAEGISDLRDCPDVRWYHFVLLILLWHFAVVLFSAVLLFRVMWKPVVLLSVVYFLVLFFRIALSFV